MSRAAVILLLALSGCGKPAPPYENRSVADLRKMLDHESPKTQAQGAVGLSLHGPEAAPALPRLLELFRSPEPLVRQQAAMAVGKIGPEAASAGPELIALLKDREWAVRRQAALALGELRVMDARPALQARTSDENALVRKAAAQALARLDGK